MSKFYRRLLTATLLAVAFLAGSVMGATFYDYAKVVSVTPVTQTAYRQVDKHICQTVHSSPASGRRLSVPEDISNSRQGYTLAEVIRQDLAAATPRTHRECSTVAVRKPHTETVAYRVRYRYDNQIYTRTMKKPPGERIRVRVELAQ